jgi:hypothetical protein
VSQGASRQQYTHDWERPISLKATPPRSQLITAQRFSCALGMLSSLGVQVPCPT